MGWRELQHVLRSAARQKSALVMADHPVFLPRRSVRWLLSRGITSPFFEFRRRGSPTDTNWTVSIVWCHCDQPGPLDMGPRTARAFSSYAARSQVAFGYVY